VGGVGDISKCLIYTNESECTRKLRSDQEINGADTNKSYKGVYPTCSKAKATLVNSPAKTIVNDKGKLAVSLEPALAVADAALGDVAEDDGAGLEAEAVVEPAEAEVDEKEAEPLDVDITELLDCEAPVTVEFPE